MTDLLRVNSTIYGWNSHSMRFDAIPYNGILSVDHEQTRERKVVYGMRRNGTPLGKTSGKYSSKGFTIKMLADSYDKWTDFLTIKGLGSYGDAEFTSTLSLVEPGQKPIIKLWTGCTIDGEKESNAEGIDEACVDVEIGALTFSRNGKQLYSVIRSLSL